MEWTDEEAAEEVRKGNQRAFRVLVERHTPPVFRLAFLMTNNEQDAEDVVQETFLRSYRHIDKFDGRAAFGSWLHRICVNCSLNLIRTRKNRKEQLPDLNDETGFNWLDQVTAGSPSPERLTESGQIAAMLGPALDMLTESERAAFILRHYEGSPIEAIAQTLGVQPGAAKQTIHRAVRKLRTALEPAWGTKR
ncbi:MAG TPA: RNA polymerase sigma factor [Bryobacteraceae bacterium]|jgi:RNA polymerase sigma-70 factor (ECF subfamily)|nr:RNA polymerase sigma factor [Bryobacteraceae bacterium]